MTNDEAVQALLTTARAEIGYRETGENQTKYAAQYDYDTRLYGFDMSGSPWCDYFVDWCFMRTFGFEVGSAMTYQYAGCSGASCAASASYYKEYGAFVHTPEVGAQIFFYVSGGINHTGIVEQVNTDTVVTIEGNSSDSVRRNTYRRGDSSIAGYGVPRWQYAEDIPSGSASESKENDSVDEIIDSTGLEVDGIVGPETWAHIAGQMPTIRRGSDCFATAALQAALNQITGANDLDIDGEFGPLTDAAVRAFQAGTLRKTT